MAWTSIVEHERGDVVNTPHGQGIVRAVSTNGTTQVEVNGQLFEVPHESVTKAGGGTPQPGQPGEFKVGDWVHVPGYSKTQVREITGVAPNGEFKTTSVDPKTGELDTEYSATRTPAEMTRASKQRSDIKKPQGEEMPDTSKPTPVKPWNVKPGDRVQTKSGDNKGEVTEVTQRMVRGKFDNGKSFGYPKKDVGHHLDSEQKQPEIKVGDQVELLEPSGGAAQPGEIGTVAAATSYGNYQQLRVDFPSQRDYSTISTKVKKVEDKPQPAPQPETKQEEQPAAQPDDTIKRTGDGLEDLMRLKEYMEGKIEKTIDGELQELRELAKKNQTLEVKVGDRVNTVPGLKHKQLEQLINYAALRLSPLLVGMAGTGKTHAGEQTAKALGLDFYSMSVGAQTSKSDIIGYMAANGQYVSTHFRKAYEEGGVFLMDEIDAGNANVLIQINAALSNGLCAFPDKMVTRHEDFVFIASANTFGNGANRQYVGRNQLDAATLDRFAVIEWFIDDELESNLTTGINGKAWYMAVRAARDYVAEKNIRALISPRATQKGSKLLHIGQDLREVIHATMLGSVPEDKKKDVEEVATKIFEKFASEVPGQLPREVNAEVADLVF